MTRRPPESLVLALDEPAALVTGEPAAWLVERILPRRPTRDSVGDEVWAALVALDRVAANYRANCHPAVVAGLNPDARSGLSCNAVEAAEQLGVTAGAVRLAARERRLHGELTVSGWRFTGEAIEDFRARRRRTA